MQLITIEVLAFQVFVQKFWMVSIELRNATNFTLGFKPVTVLAIEYVDIWRKTHKEEHMKEETGLIRLYSYFNLRCRIKASRVRDKTERRYG